MRFNPSIPLIEKLREPIQAAPGQIPESMLVCVGDFININIGSAVLTAGTLPIGLRIENNSLTGIVEQAFCGTFTLDQQEVSFVAVDAGSFTPNILSQNNSNIVFSETEGSFIEVCDYVHFSIEFTRTLERKKDLNVTFPKSMFHAYDGTTGRVYVLFSNGNLKRYTISGTTLIEDVGWGKIDIPAPTANERYYGMQIVGGVVFIPVYNTSSHTIVCRAYSITTKAAQASSNISIPDIRINRNGIDFSAPRAIGIDTVRVYLMQLQTTAGIIPRASTSPNQASLGQSDFYYLWRSYSAQQSAVENVGDRQFFQESTAMTNYDAQVIATDDSAVMYLLDDFAIKTVPMVNRKPNFDSQIDIGNPYNAGNIDISPLGPNGEALIFTDDQFSVDFYSIYADERTAFFNGNGEFITFEMQAPVGSQISEIRGTGTALNRRDFGGLPVGLDVVNTSVAVTANEATQKDRITIAAHVSLESVETFYLEGSYKIDVR